MTMNRRQFLTGTTAAGLLMCMPQRLSAQLDWWQPAGNTLRVTTRTIDVKGKAATVYGVLQPDGTTGLTLGPDDAFDVRLVNRLDKPFIMHWHGQEPPGPLDGNPYYFFLQPGSESRWFYLPRPGTHWMHSHRSLQEQKLLAAPLIVRTGAEMDDDVQDVVIMLHDFTFTEPEEILANLQNQGPKMRKGSMRMDGGPDLNDVDYDAYLANDRTLDDPDVIQVEKHGRVRLRIINAAAGTNFYIDLVSLTGTTSAVDGNPTVPLSVKRVPIAPAQRIDILLELPAGGGPWPILAQREGDSVRTGVILAAPGNYVVKVDEHAESAAAAVGADPFERSLAAAKNLPDRPVDQKVNLNLVGDMMKFTWGIETGSGKSGRFTIDYGNRVQVDLVNQTGMGHPIHFHGHHFQVIQLNGIDFIGPARDTVYVPAKGSARVIFDAMHPGFWPVHCHLLYHLAAGMIIEMEYNIQR